MWGHIVAIHSVLKKITTKLNSQPAQYEKNKIDKDNSRKKIKYHKKIMWEKHCSNLQCFKGKKTTKLNKHCSNLFHEEIYSCNS